MIKYSFVIPTYNNKELLRNALKALNYQKDYDKKSYEIIVVDDGSCNNTWEYIKEVSEISNIRYIYLERNEKSCRSRARNFGWKIAEGEIIVFLDADVIVNENHLKELDRCYAKDNSLIIFGTRLNLPDSFEFQGVEGKKIFNEIAKKNRAYFLEERHYALESLSYNVSKHRFPWLMTFSCNLAIPKELLIRVNGFDEDYKRWGAEDIDLGYRLFKIGAKILINPRLEVIHQYHPSENNGSEESQINTQYFMSKYPSVFEDIPKGMEFSIFRSDTLHRNKMFRFEKDDIMFLMDRGRVTRNEIINFYDKDKLEEVKHYIKDLIELEDVEIIINDYDEKTDLDIWIQLLENVESNPKYYPMSKKLHVKSVFGEIEKILAEK